MFRRRPFRRGIRRPVAPRRQAALRRLQKAHQLMAEESFNEAGKIFEELASAAAKRGIPRAPQLFLQAGDAALKAGDHAHGVALFTRGLHLMEKMGQFQRLPTASQRVLDELQAIGLQDEHEAMENEINLALTQRGLSLSSATPPQKRRLPGKCPQCGGIVHPQEIDWIDDTTAYCDYCGSILEESL